MVFKSQLAPQLVRAALSSLPAASARLHSSLLMLPPGWPLMLVAALAGSASTLTALHGLPLIELAACSELGLAPFTRLRALTLCQTGSSPDVLFGTVLPASLEEVTLEFFDPRDPHANNSVIPQFLGFSRLHSLRRIVLAGHTSWALGSWDGEREFGSRLQLPPSFEVRSSAALRRCAHRTYKPHTQHR